MNEQTVRAMILAATEKVKGAPVGAYLTVDHQDSESGFEFVMVGPDGRTNKLLAKVTAQIRLDAHWAAFVDNYAGLPNVTHYMKVPAHGFDEHHANYLAEKYGVTALSLEDEYDATFGGTEEGLTSAYYDLWAEMCHTPPGTDLKDENIICSRDCADEDRLSRGP